MKKMVLNHKIDRRKKNQILIVGVVAPISASAVTYGGVKMAEMVDKRYFIFNRKFPFIHKRHAQAFSLTIKRSKGVK